MMTCSTTSRLRKRVRLRNRLLLEQGYGSASLMVRLPVVRIEWWKRAVVLRRGVSRKSG